MRTNARLAGLIAAIALGSSGCRGGGRAHDDASIPVCEPAPVLPNVTVAPDALEDTGLLDASGAVPGYIREFEPRYPLHSDGAVKQRFVYLPGCAAIDASDADHWQMPAGTRLWKHFVGGGVRVETRFIHRFGPGPNDWLFATYAWDATGAHATRVDGGVVDALGTSHDVPPTSVCLDCHGGATERVLGFGAVQLPPTSSFLDRTTLVGEGRLPRAFLAGFDPPGDAIDRAALGYLHANCGSCHAPENGTSLQLRLRTTDTSVLETQVVATAFDVPANRSAVGYPLRVEPGHPETSLLLHRMAIRGDRDQMPPLATEVTDPIGIAAVTAFIGHHASLDAGVPDAGLDAGAAVDSGTPTDGGSGTCDPALTPVLSGLDVITAIAGEPADPDRVYLVQKSGVIRLLDHGTLRPAPFLDVSASSATPRVYIPPSVYAEGGLLGMTFAPSYATSGLFYLHYTSMPSGHVVVVEMRRSAADANVASTLAADLPVRTLADTPHGGWNHCGGMIAFGPDGYLYAAIGDSAVQPISSSPAPTLTDLRGKILRIDVANGMGAPGNALGLVYDSGLRNPWRFAFDRAANELYIADVGQGSWEEIDVQPLGDAPRDFGWPTMEGLHCGQPSPCASPTGTLPAIEHAHAQIGAIVGGYVVRDVRVPCLAGRYLYADYSSGRIFAAARNGSGTFQSTDVSAAFGLPQGEHPTTFGEDASGRIWLGTEDGSLYRLDP